MHMVYIYIYIYHMHHIHIYIYGVCIYVCRRTWVLVSFLQQPKQLSAITVTTTPRESRAVICIYVHTSYRCSTCTNVVMQQYMYISGGYAVVHVVMQQYIVYKCGYAGVHVHTWLCSRTSCTYAQVVMQQNNVYISSCTCTDRCIPVLMSTN